jgi:hypothetical protein
VLLRSEAIMHNIELVHPHFHLFIILLTQNLLYFHSCVVIWFRTKFSLEIKPAYLQLELGLGPVQAFKNTQLQKIF